MIKNKGYCVCCDQKTVFSSDNDWLRDNYICNKCGSIPRERALIKVIEMYYPNWKNFKIHESSPIKRGASQKIEKFARDYVTSQYWPDRPIGEIFDNTYNIDLENQSFISNFFDIVITQDVFEHLYNPQKAIQEISRTLKPNGAHICTVPLVNKEKPTVKWSEIKNDEVIWFFSPEYHGNPVNPKGSPVSYHFGYDICNLVQEWSFGEMYCTINFIDALDLGIRAEYIEVLVMRKRVK